MILFCFLAICALAGGSARWDGLALVFVRGGAVLAIGGAAIAPGPWDWRGLRGPAILLAAFTLTIAVQLVPLPPSIWAALPGRVLYLQAATVAGVPQPWRPISLAPHRTVASMSAVLPALAALVMLAGIPRRDWRILADGLLVLCCLSAALGALQFATGSFYTYNLADFGLPIGFFSNRNHQALALVIGLVLLAWWGTRQAGAGRDARPRLGVALAGILVLSTVILLTGSRTGFGLMLVTLLILFAAFATRLLRDRAPRRAHLLRLLLAFAPFAMVGLTAYVAQDSSFVRLNRSAGSLGEDLRFLALPTVWHMALHYLPWGTGFGTFDLVYMQWEPDGLLSRTFFNRAHNDSLEVVITGGIPSLIVVVAFLAWLAERTVAAFRRERGEYLSRASALAIWLSLAASVFDYPLRTPLLSVFLVFFCGFLVHPFDIRPLRGRGAARGRAPLHYPIEDSFHP